MVTRHPPSSLGVCCVSLGMSNSQATLETGGVRTRKGSQDGVDSGAAVQFSPGDDLSEIRGQGKKKGTSPRVDQVVLEQRSRHHETEPGR
ncbi:hypothetical protein CGCF413_v005488 [Colletotrichum fructicola]|nr:hypothetical protein CGCF413_v005488 [Colletotrichum fructicola]